MSRNEKPYRSPYRRHQREFFYKYTTADAAKAILQHRSLRWSAPSQFNDPFDVPHNVRLAFGEDELKERSESVYRELMEGTATSAHPWIGLAAALAKYSEATTKTEQWRSMAHVLARPLEATRGLVQQSWTEWQPKLRILCLSEIPDASVMWANYAGQGTGVVLRLKADDHVDSVLLTAQRVRYSDAPPQLPGAEVFARHFLLGEPIKWFQFFSDYFHVKQTQWKHEREWRVVTDAKDETGLLSHWAFHPRELDALYLGANVKPEDEEQIRQLLRVRYPHALIYRARHNYEARRIEFEPSLKRNSSGETSK